MIRTIKRAVRLFLHPRSPAAVYRRPKRFLTIVSAAIVNQALRLDGLVFRVERVRCDVCGWTGRCFGAHGAASDDVFEWNVLCLGCGSSVRTRALLNELKARVDLDSPKSIAEGGGSRASAEFFRCYPLVEYRNFDPYKDASSTASAVALPIADESCDAVLSCHVLEHIPEYPAAVQEMARILKPDGIAIVIVPQMRSLPRSRPTGETQLDGYGHVWEFGDDFPGILESCGLRVLETVDYGSERVNVCARAVDSASGG